VMIHYHGTPISPRAELMTLGGKCFCVSFADKRDVSVCHQIGQSVMLDNGAFSAWTRGYAVDWNAYYAWVEPWLHCPTTWAVIPDAIDAGEDAQDEFVRAWPFGSRGVPVWHMDEPIERLERLVGEWPMVCMGSTSVYRVVGSEVWEQRMTQAFNRVAAGTVPRLHMLRGMAQSKGIFPFYSVDSTDVARNYKTAKRTARAMADDWDAMQCPVRWTPRPEQMEMVA